MRMLQPVFMIGGYLISVLGIMMLFPAALDIYDNSANWSSFIISSLITVFVGASLFLGNRMPVKKITLRQGYLLTLFSWLMITMFATLPFIITGSIHNFADAVFEASSGLTTTGATILTGLDNLPRSILLWRSILSCLGGIGIVIFAVALLPFLGIGGMQMFQRENSDINDKILPKFSHVAKEIILVYLLLCIGCAVSLRLVGMNWSDALNHALTSVATSGFSTKDASIAYYNSVGVEMVLTLFMILGGIPMTFYILLAQGKEIYSIRTQQVVFFLKTLAFYITFTSLWLWYTGKYDIFNAIRYASFNVVAVVTTTGFASTDYVAWGPLAYVLFIIFSLTGGCTGSTSGSIKIFRWQVVIAYLKKCLAVATEPNRVMPIKIGSTIIEPGVVSSVYLFLSVYVFSIVILTLFVAMTGVDFTTAFSAVVACISSVGVGVGEVVGPSGNYSSFTDFAKYILSFAMLLGRLEILTVLVVFTRNFWK